MIRFICTCLAAVGSALSAAGVQDLVYRLPTENDALFRGDNEAFYMYVDRTFEGTKSKPWQAGSFGMVRTAFRASDGSIMCSRFHEGIDIKPMKRDASGEPQDIVRPIAPGVVAYTNPRPGMSNYGRYVVVAHRVPEGTIYSLYAHLASVSCETGQVVGTGNELGIMGYSGAGINLTRAHCHLEICFMVNSKFDKCSPPANKHGLFHGHNLVGMNPSDFLLACKNGDPFSLSRYVATLKEHYRVRVPCEGPIDLLVRYPFLYKGTWDPCPPAVDFSFTAEGIPIAAYPAKQKVDKPTIVFCKPMPTLQQNCTANRIKNSSKDAALTVSGLRYINYILANPDSNGNTQAESQPQAEQDDDEAHE